MDRFAARLDEYLTREQPEPTACECGNGLHYEIDRERGQCDECHAEAALDADALFVGAATEAPPALVRSLIVATSRTQLAAVRAQHGAAQ